MNSPRQSKLWHVLGAGAMGCLWAGALREAGHEVTLLLRDARSLEAFRSGRGITLLEGDQRRLVHCDADLAEAPRAPFDRLLICCKAHQTLAAFSAVAPQLRAGALVLLVQNGMGVAEELLKQRPDLRLCCGVSTDGAHRIAPFTVRRAGRGVTLLGLFPREATQLTGAALCGELDQQLLALQSSHDIYRAQWQKLAVNSVINPLTAIYDIRNGELPTHPGCRQWIPALCHEVEAVSRSQGIDLSAHQLQQRVAEICLSTAGNVSSMLQDIRQRRQTEIDYINGYLLRVGRQYGLECPSHRQLATRVAAAASGHLVDDGAGSDG